jgi:hypothetical protein
MSRTSSLDWTLEGGGKARRSYKMEESLVMAYRTPGGNQLVILEEPLGVSISVLVYSEDGHCCQSDAIRLSVPAAEVLLSLLNDYLIRLSERDLPSDHGAS